MTKTQIAKRVEERMTNDFVKGLAQKMMDSPNISLGEFLTANKKHRLHLIKDEIEQNDLLQFE